MENLGNMFQQRKVTTMTGRSEAWMVVLGLAVMSGLVCAAHGGGMSWTDLSAATSSIFQY